MSARDFYNWLVGGYYVGGSHKAVCLTAGYCLNMDSRRGRATYWLLNLDAAIRRGPRDLRWWLADQLARAAMRLRGDRPRVFGFYDCARGNRAAALIESLHHAMLMKLDHDDFLEFQDTLNELAQVKGALWFTNREGAPETQLVLIPHEIPAHVIEAAHQLAHFMEANGYGKEWVLGPVQGRRTEGGQ